MARQITWWKDFCNNYKDYYKRKSSKELFCNHFGLSVTQKGPKGRQLTIQFKSIAVWLNIRLNSGPESRSFDDMRFQNYNAYHNRVERVKSESTQVCKLAHKVAVYRPFQNHYTHEIPSLKLFRRLQLELSGVFRIN